jgi:uncharacterized membrane protein YccC
MPRPPDLRTVYAAIAVSVGAFVLGFVFWNHNTDPMWAISAFVLVYDPDTKAAYDSALSRMFFTAFGCVFSVGMICAFGLHKWLMPLALGITVFLCGYFLKFQGAWRALLVCVALVIGSSLLQPTGDIHIAMTRGIEVAAGSLLAVALSLPFGWFDFWRKRRR